VVLKDLRKTNKIGPEDVSGLKASSPFVETTYNS